MDINNTCSLIQKDVYLYDISSCHYRLLENLGYDLSGIVEHDKKKRNTQIGLLMRDKPELIPILRNTTISVISEYIKLNKISEEDLILRAYDGIIIRKKMHITTNNFISIDMQAHYELMIISSDRQRYLATTSNNDVIIKGVPNRYSEMDKMLTKLALSVRGKQTNMIFENLHKIKNEILNNSNVNLYCIPGAKDKFNIFLKEYGEVEISETLAGILDAVDIDKGKYFDYYLRPFTESIAMENI